MPYILSGRSIRKKGEEAAAGGMYWRQDPEREREIRIYYEEVWKGNDEELKWKIFDRNFEAEMRIFFNYYIKALTHKALIKERIRSSYAVVPLEFDGLRLFYTKVREHREKEQIKKNQTEYKYVPKENK